MPFPTVPSIKQIRETIISGPRSLADDGQVQQMSEPNIARGSKPYCDCAISSNIELSFRIDSMQPATHVFYAGAALGERIGYGINIAELDCTRSRCPDKPIPLQIDSSIADRTFGIVPNREFRPHSRALIHSQDVGSALRQISILFISAFFFRAKRALFSGLLKHALDRIHELIAGCIYVFGFHHVVGYGISLAHSLGITLIDKSAFVRFAFGEGACFDQNAPRNRFEFFFFRLSHWTPPSSFEPGSLNRCRSKTEKTLKRDVPVNQERRGAPLRRPSTAQVLRRLASKAKSPIKPIAKGATPTPFTSLVPVRLIAA